MRASVVDGVAVLVLPFGLDGSAAPHMSPLSIGLFILMCVVVVVMAVDQPVDSASGYQ